MSDDVRWSTADPLGVEIVLKTSTFDEHIIGDHEDSDAEYRKMLESSIRTALISPSWIVREGTRRLYYNLMTAEQPRMLKVKILKVVVENNGEVAMWTALRKGGTVSEGELVYGKRICHIPS